MIADIGLIVGLYAIARLLMEAEGVAMGEGGRRWRLVFLVPALLLVALFTLDVFLLGTDWLAAETQGVR